MWIAGSAAILVLIILVQCVTSSTIPPSGCRGAEPTYGAGCRVRLSNVSAARDEACSVFQDYDFLPVSNDAGHWSALFIPFFHPKDVSGVCQEIWINAKYDASSKSILIGDSQVVGTQFYVLASDFDTTSSHRCLTAERLNSSAILIRHRNCDDHYKAACIQAEGCEDCGPDETCSSSYPGFSCEHQCVKSTTSTPVITTTEEPAGPDTTSTPTTEPGTKSSASNRMTPACTLAIIAPIINWLRVCNLVG